MQAFEEEGGESSVWTTEAIAVCADPIPGMFVLRQTSSPFDSEGTKVVGARNPCFLREHLHGFGIFSAFGQAWLNALYFDKDLLSGNAIAGEDANGYANPWYLNGHALCG